MKTFLVALLTTIALRDPDLLVQRKVDGQVVCQLGCTCTAPRPQGAAVITMVGNQCQTRLQKKVWRVCGYRCGDLPNVFMVQL